MIGIAGVCCRLAGDLVQALGAARSRSTPNCLEPSAVPHHQVDEFMIRALTAVFDMENNGKIKKEKARQVVEKLGLGYGQEEEETSTANEVAAEEVLSGLDQASERQQLLHEAFKIFDEDGNGYIEAAEVKRVLQCLGLDKGWDITDIEKMLKVVDLNMDGKVDFTEFESMMMMTTRP
ncbi:calcium binding protein/cast, putative [Ricinus communis]|uniref:Calcium binding protein/cast, putative n=1 Tax=Ricinus communis TaxID=3988 RepID=B9SPR6_RICCO|nr:calcium binding protein/cast, putative [Ricinus communis]|eukprot:XP_002527985.1 calmodulin-like protein 7 [Ricinus communis]